AWDSPLLDLTYGVSRATDLYNHVLTGSLQSFINTYFTSTTVTVDLTKIFFSAHSKGNQIAVTMAKTKPVGLKGLMLIDPVDTDPLKFTTPVIPVGGSVDLMGVPVLVVGNELGDHQSLPLVPACCTPGYSYAHFYNAFVNSPKINLVAKYFGHLDICDDDLAAIVHLSHFCTSTPDTATHPYSEYRNFISGAIGSFVSIFANGNCDYAPYLTNTATFNTVASQASENLFGHFCF
ncbi:hypothetical protein HDU76_008084, partial [Blyttiomyces sp. JEL0837]